MAHPGDRERWSDQQLLGGIAGSDADAFRVFYRRHLSLILAFLLGETRDREVASDLAAEVFAAVMIAAARYERQGDSAVPWLVGIARNVLGKSRRRGRVDDQARRRLGFEPLVLDDADLERVPAIADDGRGEIAELVRSLPGPERDALHARIVDERDYREIAEQLQCSELVVRKRVSRGLGRLRAHLEEQQR
jgi:RNA polymerase sigma factor (sigma-70 family)